MSDTVQINGRRYYVVKEEEKTHYLPSVTTILGATSDDTGLQKWRESVGEEKANQISKFSANRGTLMHYHIEMFLTSDLVEKKDRLLYALKETQEYAKREGFTAEELSMGRKLFFNFYVSESFEKVKGVLLHEARLYSLRGGGYAGRVDDIYLDFDDYIVIADYKSSKKRKKEDWIENYKLQVSAYSIAYWEMFDKVPNRAEIWISNEIETEPQIFVLDRAQIKHYYKIFIEKVKLYHQMYPLQDNI